jgi:hypothetical protein
MVQAHSNNMTVHPRGFADDWLWNHVGISSVHWPYHPVAARIRFVSYFFVPTRSGGMSDKYGNKQCAKNVSGAL